MDGAGGVILASPVRQEPAVLREFLRAVECTDVTFWAYDDCDTLSSRQMLQDFCAVPGRRILPKLPLPALSPYRRLSATHLWTAETFDRVARIKDWIIAQFMASDAEALFLVDSDLLIHPDLPAHLNELGLPIISEVFWTRWRTQTPLLPQVWHTHPGGYPNAQWITQLRESGVYLVGGLGACTLIRRSALVHGLSFAPIAGLHYVGEDRYFCVRASVFGIPLHVDTTLPAFHLYRQDDLDPGRDWLEAGCPPDAIRNLLNDDWAASVERWLQASRIVGLRRYDGGTEPWVIDLLVALCRATDAQRVLEIGVYKGMTTVALAAAAKEVIGVDREIRVDAVNAIASKPNVRLLEGDATDIIRSLDGPFDLVYVDDGHRYEDVRAQTETVWPLIQSGGMLVFHDVLSPEDDYGVRRFVQERFPDAPIIKTKPFPWTFATGLALVRKP